jgi:hypothetical protein
VFESLSLRSGRCVGEEVGNPSKVRGKVEKGESLRVPFRWDSR